MRVGVCASVLKRVNLLRLCILFTMAFIPQKQGAETKAPKKAFQAGSKISDFNVIHKSALFLKKYPAVPTQNAEEEFVKLVEAKSSELVNRPPFGISELATSLENWLQNTAESPIITQEHKDRVASLDARFGLRDACQVLNKYHYSDLARSSDSVKQATVNLLKFLQEIRKDWSFWSQIVARATSDTVTGCWMLTGASLTSGDAWQQRMAMVPMKAKSEKAKLDEEPSGKHLRDFLVAELQAHFEVAVTRKEVPRPGAFVPLSFDSEESPQKPDLKGIKRGLQEFVDQDAPATKKGKKRALASAEALKDEVNAFFIEHPHHADSCKKLMKEFKAKVKVIKEQQL